MPKKPFTSLTIDTACPLSAGLSQGKRGGLSGIGNYGCQALPGRGPASGPGHLAATQEWEEVELVVHRFDKRQSDNTYLLSVVPEHHEVEDPNSSNRSNTSSQRERYDRQIEERRGSLKDSPMF